MLLFIIVWKTYQTYKNEIQLIQSMHFDNCGMYKSSDEQNRERPMVHIAHTRNQFKSINIVEQNHDFILTLIKRKKALSPFCEFYDSLYVKRKSLSPKNACDKFSWNWSNRSRENNCQISSIYIFYCFVIISSW